MPLANYNTTWKKGDVITADWLRDTANMLNGMYSPDGSIRVEHSQNGISLIVSSAEVTIPPEDDNEASASPVELTPYQTESAGGYLYARPRRPRLENKFVGATNWGFSTLSMGSATPADTGGTLFQVSASAFDLKPRMRIYGGYLQIQLRTIGLTITSASPPIIKLTSATYGEWQNGITAATFTCATP